MRVEPGHLVVDRYQVGVQVDDNWGVRGWRARDELLARDVLLTTCHPNDPRAPALVEAARAAARVDDHRLMRVLDAHLDGDSCYIVREWVGSRTLTDLLSSGPLPEQTVLSLGTDIAEVVAKVHEHGLSHLCLDPSCVLFSDDGALHLRGTGTSQVLRGVVASPEGPAKDDAVGLGRLLFAMLTGLLPDQVGSGLPQAPGTARMAPRQVKAGVDPLLDGVTVRALGTARSRRIGAFTSPEQVATALVSLRRRDGLRRVATQSRPEVGHRSITAQPARTAAILRPALDPDALTDTQTRVAGSAPTPTSAGPKDPPGSLTGPELGAPGGPTAPVAVGQARLPWTVKVVAVGAAALVVAGLALLAWQLLDPPEPQTRVGGPGAGLEPGIGDPVSPVDALDFDPLGDGRENLARVEDAIDGDVSTAWPTQTYFDPMELQKDGVGLIADLGSVTQVSEVDLSLLGDGSDVQVYVGSPTQVRLPASLSVLSPFGKTQEDAPEEVAVLGDSVQTRYVLVWFTRLPAVEAGWQGGVRELVVRP